MPTITIKKKIVAKFFLILINIKFLPIIKFFLSYGNIRNSGNHDYVAALCLVYGNSLKASVYEYLIYLSLDYASVFFCDGNGLSRLQHALGDSSDSQSSDIVVVAQGGNLKLKWLFSQVRVRLAVFDYRLKQRRNIQSAKACRCVLQLGASLFRRDSRSILQDRL